jgi:hypothetical protein
VRFNEFNAQQQPRFVWPQTSVVARAYLDQLTRSKAIDPQRVRALTTALDSADQLRSGREKDAAVTLERLDTLTTQLEADAAAASARDAMRLRALAATIKGRAARLR